MPPLARAMALWRRHRMKLLTIADQMMVSAVNFLTMAFIARALGIEAFGVFSLAYILFLLLKAVHQALIVAPMMSIGPKQPDGEHPTYYASIAMHQAGLVLLTVLVIPPALYALYWISPDHDLRALAIPMIAAAVGDQLQDAIRRYFFTHGRVIAAFLLDALSYGGRLAILITSLPFIGWITLDAGLALTIMGVTSLTGAAVGLLGMGRLRLDTATMGQVTRHHWTFSKWIFGMGVLQFCSGHAFTLVAGFVINAAALGALRSTMNTLAPIQVYTQALQNIAPVRASQIFHEEGAAALKAYLIKLTLIGMAFTATIALIALAFSAQIVHLLYGEDFVAYAWLVNWWVVIYAVRFLQFPLEAGLRALEYTRPLFMAVAIEAGFGLSSAVLLTQWYGLQGTMFGMMIAHCIPVLILFILFMRRIDQLKTPSGERVAEA